MLIGCDNHDKCMGGPCRNPYGQICAECGHTSAHGTYGCEYERGDAWVEGANGGALMAQGPCGCKSFSAKCNFESGPLTAKSVADAMVGGTATELQVAFAQHVIDEITRIAKEKSE